MPPDPPQWGMANVILTPYISGSSGGTRLFEQTWEIWVENVKRYRAGRPLLNQLSAARLDGK